MTKKIFLIYLYIQSFLDVIAGFLLNLGYTNYISSTIRLIFMFFIIIYLFKNDYKNKKHTIYYLLIMFIYFILYYFLHNSTYDLRLTINSYYFIIMLIGYKKIYENDKIDSKHIRNILIIYILLTIVPNIFNIGFSSYEDNKLGGSGLFFDANSLGVILLLLMINSFDNINKLNIFLKILIYALYIFAITSIGTKTPLIGFILLVLVNIIYYLYSIKNNKKKFTKILSIFLISIIITIIAIPQTNMYHNLNVYFDYLEKENIKVNSLEYIDHIVFGLRIKCEEEERSTFNKADIKYKLIGMGYSKEPTKLAEMDYFDIFYRNGIIGFIIYFIPITYYIYKSLKSKQTITNRYLLFITLLIALIGGHTFTSPSSSIFAILSFKEK